MVSEIHVWVEPPEEELLPSESSKNDGTSRQEAGVFGESGYGARVNSLTKEGDSADVRHRSRMDGLALGSMDDDRCMDVDSSPRRAARSMVPPLGDAA